MDIVIAVYRETLDWLVHFKPFLRKAYVYCKDESRTLEDLNIPGGVPYELTFLKNVGRESYVYLHHMLRIRANPEDFGSITLFTMGASTGKNQIDFAKWNTMMHILKKLKYVHWDNLEEGPEKYGPTVKDLESFQTFSTYRGTNPLNRTAYNEELQLSPVRPFGSWYAQCIEPFTNAPLSSSTFQRLVYHAAIFAISNRQVARYPKHFYEALYQQTQQGVSPEVSHYLERTWKILFDAV